MLGAIGEDGFGMEFVARSHARGIASRSVASASPQIATFTYTKLINQETGEEDRPRVDFITPVCIPADVEHEIPRPLAEAGSTDST